MEAELGADLDVAPPSCDADSGLADKILLGLRLARTSMQGQTASDALGLDLLPLHAPV